MLLLLLYNFYLQLMVLLFLSARSYIAIHMMMHKNQILDWLSYNTISRCIVESSELND